MKTKKQPVSHFNRLFLFLIFFVNFFLNKFDKLCQDFQSSSHKRMLKQTVCLIFTSGLLSANAFVHGSPASARSMLRADSNFSTRHVSTKAYSLRNDYLMSNISDFGNYLQLKAPTNESVLLPKPVRKPKTPCASHKIIRSVSYLHFNTTTTQKIEMCQDVDKQLTALQEQITECKQRLDKMLALEESVLRALLTCDDLKLLEKQTSSCVVYKENLTEERKLFFLREALQNLTQNLYKI